MVTNNTFIKQRTVLIHILVWMVFISIGAAANFFSNPGYRLDIVDTLLTVAPNIFIFYSSYYGYTKLFNKKRLILLLPAELALFAGYLFIYYVIGQYISPLVNPGAPVPPLRLTYFIISGLWTFLVYSIYSFGYYFAQRSIRSEQQLRILERDRLQFHQERLQAEYAFLRSQINPHFLHNTLNYFYAKSLGCSEELSEGILALSEIMRYSLHGGDGMNLEVPLNKEVEHLENVIKINQLRYSNRLNIDWQIKGETKSARIIPLVLITLVENAFKHGDLHNEQYPIALRLTISENGQLEFYTQNRKKNGPRELSHGIGLNNIRKRLEWAYGNNYIFNLKEDAFSFETELLIKPGMLITHKP
jgi:two-component system LytT family sensor kinase